MCITTREPGLENLMPNASRVPDPAVLDLQHSKDVINRTDDRSNDRWKNPTAPWSTRFTGCCALGLSRAVVR
jgi:hypothetical protein